jgi:pyruvate/oxaloacetate carboxyltransferase
MNKRNLLSSMAAIALTGCSTVSYQAVPINSGEGQKVTYERGVSTVASAKTNSEVRLHFNQYSDGRLFFEANMKNLSPQNIDVGIESVSVKDQNGLAILPLTADQLVEEAKSSATSQKVGVGIGVALGILGALAASQRTETGTYEDRDGRRRPYSRTTNDPAVALAGSALSVGAGAYGFSEINKARDEKLDAIQRYYIQKTTISPQSSLSGIFEFPMPKGKNFPQNIDINLQVAGDSHSFEFKIDKTK